MVNLGAQWTPLPKGIIHHFHVIIWLPPFSGAVSLFWLIYFNMSSWLGQFMEDEREISSQNSFWFQVNLAVSFSSSSVLITELMPWDEIKFFEYFILLHTTILALDENFLGSAYYFHWKLQRMFLGKRNLNWLWVQSLLKCLMFTGFIVKHYTVSL